MLGRIEAAVGLAMVAVLVPATPAQPTITLPDRAAIVLGDNPRIPDQSPAPTVYGWAWPGQVQVFDGTLPGNNFRIAEAVGEYRKGGIDLVMTSDPAQAEITVTEEYDQCGYTGPGTVLGCAYLSGGIGHDVIHLNPAYRTWGLAEHVGGHELGHTIGLAHYYGSGRSWMKPAVNESTYMTRPGPIDMADVRSLYR